MKPLRRLSSLLMALLVICAAVAEDTTEPSSSTTISTDATTVFNDTETIDLDTVLANFTGEERSAEILDFDVQGRSREGRILNTDGNSKLSIKGFIPIVSLSSEDERRQDAKSHSSYDPYYTPSQPYPPAPLEPLPPDAARPPKPINIPITPGQHVPQQQYPAYVPNQRGDRRQVNSKVVIPQDVHNPQVTFVSNSQNYPVPINTKPSGSDYYIPPKSPASIFPQHQQSASSDQGSQAPIFPQRQSPISPSGSSVFLPQGEHVTRGANGGPYFVNTANYPSDNHGIQDGKHVTPKQLGFFNPSQSGSFDVDLSQQSIAQQDNCICVPFYMCRNGFVVNYGRSLDGPTIPIDERTPKKVSKRDVRNNTDATSYSSDVSERVVPGLGNSCGLLRRCCRVPPVITPGGLLPPFHPETYPLPHPQPDIQAELFPPHLQKPGIDGSYILRPGQHGHDISEDFPGQEVIVVPGDHSPHPQQEIVISGGHQGAIIPGGRPPRPGLPTYPGDRPQYPPQGVSSGGRPHRPVAVNPGGRPPYLEGITSGSRPPRQEIVRPYPLPPVRPGPFPRPEENYPPRPVYPHPKPVAPSVGVQYGTCGRRHALGIHGRVKNLQYHDDSTEFGEYPWQVAILQKVSPGNNLYVCGGTLISSQWVATAAHCLKKAPVRELKVRLGDWDVHRDDEFYPYEEKQVVDAIIHPEYYPGNLNNDLALLHLDSPIHNNAPHISPICLPNPQEDFTGRRCWVTGWGKDAFGRKGGYQSVLKEVDVPVIGHQDCEHRFRQTRLGPYYQLHPGFLCAGGEAGKDACEGDGGSPLVCDIHGEWRLAGLVSWGIGCGQPGVPGVYVNMAKYRLWIDSIVGRQGYPGVGLYRNPEGKSPNDTKEEKEEKE